jgi:uncharacterized protein
MQPFVFRLLAPRPTFASDMSATERSVMHEHAEYWARLASEGRVVAFGPVADPAGAYGIGIVLASDLIEAGSIRDSDPAMLSAHGFRTEIAPMLRLVTPERSYDATPG